jgi:hypothetical protein
MSPRAPTDPGALLGALDVLADVLAPKVAARLRAEELPPTWGAEPPVTWYTQDTSPLPRRTYLDLCRSRAVESRRVGKTILVERRILDEWILAHGAVPSARSAPAPPARAAPTNEDLMRAAGFHRVAPRAAKPDPGPASGRRRRAGRRRR